MLTKNGSIKKLLLIDDEDTIRDSIRMALEDQDLISFEFFESTNVSDGLIMARQIIPDVIILDLHMPDMTGFDFMDLVAKDSSLSTCQVIMLTADDTIENIIAAERKSISPFRFISKPFDTLQLQAVVYEAAGLAKAR